MARYKLLRSTDHANAGFQRARDYSHAVADRVAPVLIDELAHLIPYMPLGFVGGSESTSDYKLVAIQGLDTAVNLYVHPTSHKWLTGYTPACYRAYPFALGGGDGEEKRALCFDTLSGLLREPAGPQDIAFFDDQGVPTQAVRDVVDFLKNREMGLKHTQAAVNALSQHAVIEPWPIVIEKEGVKTKIQGLYKINKNKLLQLSPKALEELNLSGALKIAYAQFFSMPQFKHLQKLAQLHGTVEPALESGELNSLFDDDNENDFTFDFDS